MLLKSPSETAGHQGQQLEIWEERGRSWSWGLPQHGRVDVTDWISFVADAPGAEPMHDGYISLLGWFLRQAHSRIARLSFMSGTVLGAKDAKVNKRNTDLDVKELTFWWG